MVKGLVTVFPTSIRPRMRKINWDGLEEIRVRIGWPVELIYGNHNEWLGNYDSMIDRQCLDEMLNYITGYSLYAMEEELKQGYITFSGGHRIGVTGHATYEALRDSKEPKITNIIDIGGLNIRIAHERKGCAEGIIPFLRKGDSIYNTIFFAAPGVGKTTYLRDAIRILSDGVSVLSDGEEKYVDNSKMEISMENQNKTGVKICVVDERCEIAACVNGIPQNDLGRRTDVLDACPKLAGMRMVLRSMSPEVIAVDELGDETEFALLQKMCTSGVKILGTMHAGDMEDVQRNVLVRECMKEGIIERFVELVRLANGERTFRIYDGQGKQIWQN